MARRSKVVNTPTVMMTAGGGLLGGTWGDDPKFNWKGAALGALGGLLLGCVVTKSRCKDDDEEE